MISPTQLIIQSIGLAPVGTEVATAAGRCVMCGGTYAEGDVIEPFSPKDSFNDYPDLAHPTGSHVCGACKATWRAEFQQGLTKSLVCADGYYPFFSNDAVSYWLLNPPPPPYLMFISTKQRAHVVWKAPVNMSRDLMFVRHDDKILRIRRGHLLECIDAAHVLSNLLVSAAQTKTPKKAARPFINPLIVDRTLQDARHGMLREDVPALAGDDPAALAAIRTLQLATPGEAWALAHLLYATNPVKPEPSVAFGQF